MASLTTLTYKALFNDPSNNPYGSGDEAKAGYAATYAHWRVEDNPPTPEAVQQETLVDFQWAIGAMGYFISTPGNPNGILHLGHGLYTHPGVAGRPSPDRGVAYGFVGDVHGIDIESYALEVTQFERTPEVGIAATPIRHQELLDLNPGMELMGAFDAALPTTRIVRTRRTMYIPYPLVPFVMGRDLNARQTWEILYPQIIAQDLQVTCGPLLDWLQAAGTEDATAHGTSGVVLPFMGSMGHHVRPEVTQHRREHILYKQLPGLRPTIGQVSDPALLALSQEVANLASNAREDREDRRAHREDSVKPKTVREKYGDRLTDKLKVLTCASTDDHIPMLYHRLAQRRKGESERSILQDAVNEAADALQVATFKVTTQQVLCLRTWDYSGDAKEEVGLGLLPMSITPTGATSAQAKKRQAADRAQSEQWDMSGDAVSGSITTTDAARLRNTKGYVAYEWPEAVAQLRYYAPS